MSDDERDEDCGCAGRRGYCAACQMRISAVNGGGPFTLTVKQDVCPCAACAPVSTVGAETLCGCGCQ